MEQLVIDGRRGQDAPAPPQAREAGAAVVRFVGFSLEDDPVVCGVPGLPGQIVAARSAVPLRREQIGMEVVVVFEGGAPARPIILGVLRRDAGETGVTADADAWPPLQVQVQVDDDRLLISAEREIVLRCGDASLTLTRAGKVLIRGSYILSRSSGYNKIKGAAVDIN
ncbi:DUF6484 domain-containing protein [Pseudoduganella namucuonensis]|uniref:DUF6484 domain-containing protein n=1 Tax=Pseudoduganella namucuonensis TaxID=1035707 RepID=A0A1I7KPR0_9BURK|nr:DUF6484 domain-containing protein [Pseudoduganella namucuonensis]SFU99418.1 hypothetical protein SAMN05216552_1018109 [Pseudoduganella namucuonensis]